MLEMGLAVSLVALVSVASSKFLAERLSNSLTFISNDSTQQPGSNILLSNDSKPAVISDSPGGVTKDPGGPAKGAPLRGGLSSGFFGR
jgi:hypothetical protein